MLHLNQYSVNIFTQKDVILKTQSIQAEGEPHLNP